MDIQIYTQKMMAQIREHPQGAVSEFEHEISRADFIKIAASILKNYGGTASHKFLLKYNQSFLSLDINELQVCVALIEDDVYGLDALVAFYFFFTNIHQADFFDAIGVPEKMYKKYLGNNYHDNPFNKKLLANLNLKPEDITALQNMTFRQEKRVA